MATQPEPEMPPTPSQPAQPAEAPAEISPPGHDVDMPDPGTVQTPGPMEVPGQPMG